MNKLTKFLITLTLGLIIAILVLTFGCKAQNSLLLEQFVENSKELAPTESIFLDVDTNQRWFFTISNNNREYVKYSELKPNLVLITFSNSVMFGKVLKKEDEVETKWYYPNFEW